MRPKEYEKYDLYQESHTETLWFFEGFTAYYDDLILLKSGVINKKEYLTCLSKTFNSVMNTSGRKVMDLSQSSFDAWTVLYMPDANTSNISVSYYTKGSLFALYLDYWIQKNTDKLVSLDNVMQYLWREYGMDFDKKCTGISKVEVRQAVKKFLRTICMIILMAYLLKELLLLKI